MSTAMKRFSTYYIRSSTDVRQIHNEDSLFLVLFRVDITAL